MSDEKAKLKAYSVSDDWEEASVLVFAESASVAKSIAQGTDWLCDSDWIALRAKREPGADKHADVFGRGALDCYKEAQCEVLRDLGWYELENDHSACELCEKCPWEMVDGSALDDGICGRCRRAMARCDQCEAAYVKASATNSTAPIVEHLKLRHSVPNPLTHA